MLIVADTHVHLYPCYHLGNALKAACQNLTHLAETAPRANGEHDPEARVSVLCLTERSDCNFFKAFRSGRIDLGESGYGVQDHGADTLVLSRPGTEDLMLILPGRQIVTSERLEVLALTADLDVPDGLSLREALARIRGGGAIPVLNWSPGKWFFGRGKVVRAEIERSDAGELWLGDCTLRPTIWAEPRLMNLAQSRGLRVIAGSDPLPFAGEEQYIGTYGIVGRSDFNWREPGASFRHMLRDTKYPFTRVGRRGSVGTVWQRLRQNREAKKISPGLAGICCSQ